MTSESIIALLDRFETWAQKNAVKPSWRLLRGWIEANYPQAHDKDALADEVWATPPGGLAPETVLRSIAETVAGQQGHPTGCACQTCAQERVILKRQARREGRLPWAG